MSLALLLFLILPVESAVLPARTAPGDTLPEFTLTEAELAAHLRFLASDELRGRRAGSPDIDVAARYLAEQFRLLGVGPAPGTDDYMQVVPLEEQAPAGPGRLVLGADTLDSGDELVTVAGTALDQTAPIAFAGYGIVHARTGRDDFADVDLAGRIVVTRGGFPADSPELSEAGRANVKRREIQERGGLALVELYEGAYRGMRIPFGRIAGYWARPGLTVGEPGVSLPHIVIDDTDGRIREALESGTLTAATLVSAGRSSTETPCQNVAAWIEGSDPTLADEVVLLSAHYDHVGIGTPSPVDADSIYNGARDNGMGTVALLGAARALQQVRPRRSVLLVALTGEEVGLFGSRFYVEHPLVPLNQTVFVLNTDGAGYTDTSRVTVIGLERTSARQHIVDAAHQFGLEATPDPVPDQNLFDRSDNVMFAQAGVPAPTFSPGFHDFDDALTKYYHQPSDEADEFFDFAYLRRYVQAFVNATRRIADDPAPPTWTPGDRYEAAARALYGAP